MAFFCGALRLRHCLRSAPAALNPRSPWLRRPLSSAHPSPQAAAAATAAAAAVASSSSSTRAAHFLPGATLATLLMLAALHARRLYDENKLEQQRAQGDELKFSGDWKASFLQVLPLRFISRRWGEITALELPLWLRPFVYSGWARAFHSNLDEASKPIEEYPSLRAFFTRKLKDGVRPLDITPTNLISPVDGVVIGFGQVKGPGSMIEQVKGFSYSLSALLGAPPQLSGTTTSNLGEDNQILTTTTSTSPPIDPRFLQKQATIPKPLENSLKSLFYCVLYLGPGDYHRIHAPCDWHISLRRHFAGKLFPVNTRAVRSIPNLYVVNERVVLEGSYSQGLMAMAAVGATNVGSIEVALEPELRTNLPLMGQAIVRAVKYGEAGEGVGVKGGEEVAVFNLGSTVVLVFEAPDDEFRFLMEKGGRVKMGEAIGKW